MKIKCADLYRHYCLLFSLQLLAYAGRFVCASVQNDFFPVMDTGGLYGNTRGQFINCCV